MSWKKKLLKKSCLYAIIDKNTVRAGKSVVEIVNTIKNSGVDIIQYRNKSSCLGVILEDCRKIGKILQKAKPIFIVNDHIDIAKITGSDGVHLGQGDIPIVIARRLLGKDKIIGVSCHSLKQAVSAQKEGADYISIGPIFPTPTKPEYKAVGLKLIKKVKDKIKVPFFAIGGINEKTLAEALKYKATKVAVCRPICQNRDALGAIKKLKKQLIQK